ncbi:MAG: 1-hydroxycarotenoid 3,4-desaturase CrtD [Candidatus Marisimplicoccus sp.]
MKKKVIVIGSGIAGIAVSIRLRTKGYDVEVYEKNDNVGGKLSDFYIDNFRHDFGPKLFTMPNLIEDIFTDAGVNIDEYFKYDKLDIACKYFWDDGYTFNAYSDNKRFINEVQKKFNKEEDKVKSYISRSKKKFNLVKTIFLEKSLHRISTYLSLDAVKAIFNILQLNIFITLDSLNKRYFRDKKLIQIFNRFATYNGSSPYLISGIMSIIQHLEHDLGVFMPKKGISDISHSLYSLALDIGVKFHFNSEIDQILMKDKSVVGVLINNINHKADIIISNMDVSLTYDRLLKGYNKPFSVKNFQPSSSAVVFYWNMNKSFSNINVHNIIFSKDQEKEFDYIFNKKSIYNDPTVYICSTSKIVKEDAPAGCENWFILINSPFDNGQDWEKIKKDLRNNIIKKINSTLKVEIENNIINEKILTPVDIETETLSKFGSLYGSSSNSLQSAFIRHPNFSKNINNLYFCGGSVHPGGGIPLCLNSAKIVSELIN